MAFSEKELFETVPVPKAVAALAVPTIISQIVTMIYNLADTFFIGQMKNPYMVAAISFVYPWFNLITALGNLFGIGGSSLISRMLGRGEQEKVKYVSAFSIYGGAAAALCFALVTLWRRFPILGFLGSSPDTTGYAEKYLLWVVVIGGVPSVLSLTLAHLLRSEGNAKQASLGMMLGGLLNMALDPLLIFGLRLGVSGAAIATVLSNTISALFFLCIYWKLRRKTAVSFLPRFFSLRFVGPICSVGLASALATTLASASNMAIVKIASSYGDIPVAAYGVVKKIDMFPLGVSMGLCQGFMLLVGYNYAARNYRRMREVSIFSWKAAMVLSTGFVLCFFCFSAQLVHAFIPETETSRLGSQFLRIACLAVPLTAVNGLISYTLQAMGKGGQSAILTSCRQGLVNIPLLYMMSFLFGLYGMIWTQLVTEVIMLPASLLMYYATLRKLNRDVTEPVISNRKNIPAARKQ